MADTGGWKKELDALRGEVRALEARAELAEGPLAIEYVREFVRGELERKDLAEREAATEDASKIRQFVQNDKTAVIHAVALAAPLVPPLEWATRCGWKFAPRPHTLIADVPADAPWRSICDRCLPLARSQARRREGSSDEDRSDAGSSE